LFIWSEKELINDIISILENKNFVYIENFAVILLNPKLKETLECSSQSNKENAAPKNSKLSNSKITSFFKVQPKKEEVLKDSIQEETPNKISALTSHVKQSLKSPEDYSSLREIDPRQLLDNRQAEFFFKSKRILLMFRRVG